MSNSVAHQQCWFNIDQPHCTCAKQSKQHSWTFSIYTKVNYTRRLMGSTNQADLSCLYFRISWILIERP